MATTRISCLRRNVSLSTYGANQQRQSFYSRAQLLSDIFGANTHILCHVLAILSSFFCPCAVQSGLLWTSCSALTYLSRLPYHFYSKLSSPRCPVFALMLRVVLSSQSGPSCLALTVLGYTYMAVPSVN
jgi:hypothetical protein